MNIEVYGDRIRQARVLRRLTRARLAEMLGWAPATQTRLERTERKGLETGQAKTLADQLRVSLEFLTAPPFSAMQSVDLRFRAPSSTTQQEKEYLVEFARFTGEFIGWLDERHALPPVRLPRLPADSDPYLAAYETRQAIGSASDPIQHLIHTAERAGIVVVSRSPAISDGDAWDKSGDTWIERPDKGERHFGYSTWVGPFKDRPLMVLRAIDSWERTRWTVAHEIGHIVLHHNEVPEDAEHAASIFASELLAPAKYVRKEIPKHPTLSSLVTVKLKWGISLGALIRHLSSSGLVTSERCATLSKQLYTRKNPATGRSWGMDEPGKDEREVEKPRVLSAWCERCIGTSTPSALANLEPIWPFDVLNSMLAVQRRATGVDEADAKRSKLSKADLKERLVGNAELGQVIPLFPRKSGY